MATYVNDLRLKEISTGDESGTWGTSTNTNLELIGEALGYATEQSFGSDADATTTVADGASDPARAMYFKVTSAGSLTATRTLTIAPNTVSRVMFIENATSGSQSIAISQGSGANVTIATGKTAIVYLDGAGSGAAVVDAMAGVDPGVTDTLAEVLTAGNTSSGTNIELTTTDKVQFRDSAIYINSSADGQLDIVADTEVQIAATTVDINGNVDISGAVTAAGLTVSNSSLQVKLEEADGTNNPRLVTYFDSSGTHLQHTWSSGADSLFLEYGGSEGSGTKAIGIQNGDVSFYEDTGTTPKMFWDASAERLGIGTISPYSALTVDTANGILNIANGNTSGGTKIQAWAATPANGYLAIEGYDKEYMRIDSSGNVGIGTSSPSSYLAEGSNLVIADSSHSGITLASGASSEGGIFFADGTSGSDRFRGMIRYNHASNYMEFRTDAGERVRIDASGNVGIGTSSPTADLSVGSTSTSSGDIHLRTTKTAAAITPSNTAAGGMDIGVGFASGGQGPLTFTIGSTEAMRIDASGNVGIGASSPNFNLTSYKAGANANYLQVANGSTGVSSANGTLFGVDSSGNGAVTVQGAFSYITSVAGAERMRIDSSGNVGIGTTSAGAGLHVNRGTSAAPATSGTTQDGTLRLSSAATTGILDFGMNGANPWIQATDSGGLNNNYHIALNPNGGNVGVGTATPGHKFDVNGGNVAVDAGYGLVWSGATARIVTPEDNSVGGLFAVAPTAATRFMRDTTESMRISGTGQLLIGDSASSYIHDKGLRVVTGEVGSHALDSAVNIQGSGGDFYPLSITGPSNVGFGKLVVFSASTDSLYWQYRASGSSTFLTRVDADGDFHVYGALSKNSGSFRIDHPLPEKTATHDLVHSFIEGPQADNIYRGAVDLVDGSATVNIDTAAGMTEGTYVALNTNTQCFTSNESGWTAVKGSVSGNTLTITAQENTCTDTVSWMVVGERKDPHMIAAKWTDENGKVIVEPLKENN